MLPCSAGKEISEEEGAISLIPSSSMLWAGLDSCA